MSQLRLGEKDGVLAPAGDPNHFFIVHLLANHLHWDQGIVIPAVGELQVRAHAPAVGVARGRHGVGYGSSTSDFDAGLRLQFALDLRWNVNLGGDAFAKAEDSVIVATEGVNFSG